MGDEQNGLGRMSAAMQPHHKVFLVGERPKHMDIFRSKTSSAETSCHGFRGRCHIASGSVSGVDLNQLFKYIARDLVFWSKSALLRDRSCCGKEKQHKGRGTGENRIFHCARIINSYG